MHFHWASEHTIRDQHYGLELHLVHYQQKFDSLAKAAQAKNGIAVLAVLFHISEHDNHNIEKLLHHAEPLMSEPEVLAHYSDELMLDDFMPNDRSKYYRYEGSLTTPGCAEDVIWTVFSESLHISLGQVERFKLVKTESGRELTHNFRSTQPFNGRTLVYVSPQQNDDISYEQ